MREKECSLFLPAPDGRAGVRFYFFRGEIFQHGVEIVRCDPEADGVVPDDTFSDDKILPPGITGMELLRNELLTRYGIVEGEHLFAFAMSELLERAIKDSTRLMLQGVARSVRGE